MWTVKTANANAKFIANLTLKVEKAIKLIAHLQLISDKLMPYGFISQSEHVQFTTRC